MHHHHELLLITNKIKKFSSLSAYTARFAARLKFSMHTFSTLPVEILHRIMDHQNEQTLFCSMHNVCRRLNEILSSYERYRTLTKLDLSSNRIGAEGTRHIGDALPTNMTLTKLDLSSNQIGAEGTRHIGDALPTNMTLTKLDLSSNQIGAEGARHIGDALPTNMTLTKLDLSSNQIGAEGAQLIEDALDRNASVNMV
ncbi:unnamed protein product [Adineta ricciae]|uniref:F-box domain-containing protein n=1 Tax=Adineta ricciae TaxID=249248 RepID=A0A814NIT9_ADIRI|nr:unnamed protein product [Adineta ricciae]CAF1175662.1 unnamed protein product [Adineta ricciae]